MGMVSISDRPWDMPSTEGKDLEAAKPKVDANGSLLPSNVVCEMLFPNEANDDPTDEA